MSAPGVASRHNLPVETNSFVGRERDLDEVCGLFGETRLLTLCGSGGIGKSRFALRAATRLVGRFPDGVRMVALAKISRPELVVHELAGVLGLQDEGRPLTDMIRDMLRGSRMLLLLDNCEHLVDTVAAIADQLLSSCPGLCILATSREPLKIPGELVWRVPALRLPEEERDIAGSESVRLFMDRAQATGSGLWLTADNAASVAELCRALDGIPLALELAAARTRVLSPQQIAARIGDRFVLLTSNDRTAPPRHRTLLAAVQWSHDLLEEHERVLLRRLSVFSGSFDLDLAEAVCADEALPRSEILDLLAGLIDKSLVVRDGEAMYRLLETIKSYAADRLTEAGEREQVRHRHLDVMTELVQHWHWEVVGAPRVPWQAKLEAVREAERHYDSLRDALGWAVESGSAEKGMHVACSLMPYWVGKGMWQEARGWYDRVLALDLTGVPPAIVGRTWTSHACVLSGQDLPGEMLTSALRGLELQREDAPGWHLGMAYNQVAVPYLLLGDHEGARPHAEKALAVGRSLEDPWNIGMATTALSAVAALKGQFKEAQRWAEESLAAFMEHDHPWGVASAMNALGRLAEVRGDPDAAADYYRTSMQRLREIGAWPALARGLAGLGAIAARQHDFVTARSSLAESLRLSRETGQQLAVARGLAAWAGLVEAEGDLERAVLLTAASTALREAIGRPVTSARVEKLVAAASAQLGGATTDDLWARGRGLTVAEAIALTEGQAPPQRPAEPYRAPEHASVLTAREREIVQLIARGLSNRAIAEELVISPATVARHVANILTKLGYTSRTQVAAWELRGRT